MSTIQGKCRAWSHPGPCEGPGSHWARGCFNLMPLSFTLQALSAVQAKGPCMASRPTGPSNVFSLLAVKAGSSSDEDGDAASGLGLGQSECWLLLNPTHLLHWASTWRHDVLSLFTLLHAQELLLLPMLLMACAPWCVCCCLYSSTLCPPMYVSKLPM